MLEGILRDTSAESYELWLSGSGNFRYKIYPEYKANRADSYRPKWEKDVKQYLVDHWQANYTEGIEADDMLGIRQMEEHAFRLFNAQYEKGKWHTIICHLDKDINQIPGWHYNWELNRLGKTVREKRQYFVTLEKGNRYFYYQLLIGDPTDNIKGVVGVGPKRANLLLDSHSENEWYEAVQSLYGSEEELDMNAQCIYIWRKQNDNWRNILNDPTEQ